MTTSRLRLPAAASLLLLIAFTAAACGGSSSSSSSSAAAPATSAAASTAAGSASQDAWATGFCGAFATWRTALQQSVTMAKDPANLNADGLNSALTNAVDATTALTADLATLGAPTTAGGAAVKTSIDELKTGLDSDIASLKSDAPTDSMGTGKLVTNISSAAATLAAMIDRIQTTVTTVSAADPAGELKTALQSNSVCQSLTS